MAPALTEDSLTAVGLAPQPLAALTMDVVRTSAKGKWHVPGDGLDRCQHLTRAYGYQAALPTQAVSVFGDYDWCSTCAHRVGLPGPAGLFHAASGMIVTAARWVAELEHLAAGMDWLQISRWTSQTPYGPPDPMPALLGQLVGVRGWAKHRLAAQTAWTLLVDRAEAAYARARQAAGPPGPRALAAAARDVVHCSRETRQEALLVETIGRIGRRTLYQPDLCGQALDSWVAAVAADGDAQAGHTAMLAAVERHCADAAVHDVSLLPDPALTPADGHSTPAAWAAAEYRAMQARLVARWCERLHTALQDAQDQTGVGERLLLVVGWPITADSDREIAYITQYPILAQTVLTIRDVVYPAPSAVPRAVVLRVPDFAAEHAVAHRSNHLGVRAGAPLHTGGPIDALAVRALVRHAAGFVTEDTTDDPDELPQVAQWRAQARTNPRYCDLTASVDDHVDLPFHWRWIPSGPETGSMTFLAHLCEVLRRGHQQVILRVAAGDPDNPHAVDLIVYPVKVTPDTTTLSYVAYDIHACPQVDVPLRRIISLSEAR